MNMSKQNKKGLKIKTMSLAVLNIETRIIVDSELESRSRVRK